MTPRRLLDEVKDESQRVNDHFVREARAATRVSRNRKRERERSRVKRLAVEEPLP